MAIGKSSMTKEEQLWYDALVAKGHVPAMDEGHLNLFFVEADPHNGPGCTACRSGWCHHCDDVDAIDECPAPAKAAKAANAQYEQERLALCTDRD